MPFPPETKVHCLVGVAKSAEHKLVHRVQSGLMQPYAYKSKCSACCDPETLSAFHWGAQFDDDQLSISVRELPLSTCTCLQSANRLQQIAFKPCVYTVHQFYKLVKQLCSCTRVSLAAVEETLCGSPS